MRRCVFTCVARRIFARHNDPNLSEIESSSRAIGCSSDCELFEGILKRTRRFTQCLVQTKHCGVLFKISIVVINEVGCDTEQLTSVGNGKRRFIPLDANLVVTVRAV